MTHDASASARDWADAGADLGDDAVAASFARAKPVRPSIEVCAGKLHVLATEPENALIGAKAPLYVRGGLVRPIVDDLPAAHGRRTKVARLVEVDSATLLDHLSRCADFVKFDGRKKATVATDPPRDLASIILSREGEWRFRKLAGVITTPTLRPDGTILSKAGYDPSTQLLLLDPPPLPLIPERPSRQQAQLALGVLDELLTEFPFVPGASRSVALSGLITPVVRAAMPVAPMHAYSAPGPGSGKSYKVDIAFGIASGQRAPVIAAGRDEAETERRIAAALIAGQPIVSIDNVNGQLGGDALCQMIERPLLQLRVLGASKIIRIDNNATWFATGNNIQLVGDMTRRVLLCSLDPAVERPELREFRARPFNLVLADRVKYVAAALTIARAYIVAGCPGELPALASFEDWSRIVRSALVWLGREDPVDTMEAARAEDPVISSMREVFRSWHRAVGSTSHTTGKIKIAAEQAGLGGNRLHPELHQALCAIADDHRGGVDTKALGNWLGRHKGRIVDRLKLQADEDAHAKQKVWSVVQV
jgi:putative DNA primase/helicase